MKMAVERADSADLIAVMTMLVSMSTAANSSVHVLTVTTVNLSEYVSTEIAIGGSESASTWLLLTEWFHDSIGWRHIDSGDGFIHGCMVHVGDGVNNRGGSAAGRPSQRIVAGCKIRMFGDFIGAGSVRRSPLYVLGDDPGAVVARSLRPVAGLNPGGAPGGLAGPAERLSSEGWTA